MRKQQTNGVYDWSWFGKGMARIVSLPALVLMSAFSGLGGITREAGIAVEYVIFIIPTIWALPSILILVSGIAAGASLFAIAAAVSLAAIRMLPMTMALVPEIRTKGSKTWHMVLVSNCVAVTAWIHTLQVAKDIPRPGRLPYFFGFASTMMVACTVITATVHQLAADFPPTIMALLYFLTPIYFLTIIWNSSRVKAEYLALVLGFFLGPIFFLVIPEANILFAGLVGGVASFLFHLYLRSRGSDRVNRSG